MYSYRFLSPGYITEVLAQFAILRLILRPIKNQERSGEEKKKEVQAEAKLAAKGAIPSITVA